MSGHRKRASLLAIKVIGLDLDQRGQCGAWIGMDIDPSEIEPVSVPPCRPIRTVDALMALSLTHRLQAESTTCPQEWRELQQVADIYMVLATIDVPIDQLELLALSAHGPGEPQDRRAAITQIPDNQQQGTASTG
jgi:hypothetical protein